MIFIVFVGNVDQIVDIVTLICNVMIVGSSLRWYLSTVSQMVYFRLKHKNIQNTNRDEKYFPIAA